jgi:hypothetical protein
LRLPLIHNRTPKNIRIVDNTNNFRAPEYFKTMSSVVENLMMN